MLLFKKRFLDAIRRGEKTQTIRLWKVCRFKAGQRSYIPGVGYIRVESVDAVSLVDLTDADAAPDGFPDVVSLRAELDRLYAEQPSNGLGAYRLRFSVFPPEVQEEMREAKRKRREE
jgi:hypothetical protein